VEAIAELTRKIRHRYRQAAKASGRMAEITLSVSPFVPKPWTPFQWCAMEDQERIKERLNRVRKELRKEPNVTVTSGLAKWAYLEALFARGDRRVHSFLLDSLDRSRTWKDVLRRSSLNPDFFVYRERAKEETFPWDFVDHGVSRDALYREYERRFVWLGTDSH